MKALRHQRLAKAIQLSLLLSLPGIAAAQERTGTGRSAEDPHDARYHHGHRFAHQAGQSGHVAAGVHPRPREAREDRRADGRRNRAAADRQRQRAQRQVQLVGQLRLSRPTAAASAPARRRSTCATSAPSACWCWSTASAGSTNPPPRASAAAPTSTPFRWRSSSASKCWKTAPRRSTVPTPSPAWSTSSPAAISTAPKRTPTSASTRTAAAPPKCRLTLGGGGERCQCRVRRQLLRAEEHQLRQLGAVGVPDAGHRRARRQLGHAAGPLHLLRSVDCRSDPVRLLRSGHRDVVRRDPQRRHHHAGVGSERPDRRHLPRLQRCRPFQLRAVQPAADAEQAQGDVHQPQLRPERQHPPARQGAVQQPYLDQPGRAGADLRRSVRRHRRHRRHDHRPRGQPVSTRSASPWIPPPTSASITRRPVEVGPRIFNQDVDTTYFNVGLDGSFGNGASAGMSTPSIRRTRPSSTSSTATTSPS